MARPVAAAALLARGAPLEYWFLKLNIRGLAFLVDLIADARGGEVRVSYWHGSHGRVIHQRSPTAATDGSTVRIGQSVIGPDVSAGAADGVEWRLRYEAGPDLVDPGRFTHRLRPFDMELLSVPGTLFEGEVVVDGERFAIDAAHGLLAHYWGRRLPPQWHWVSVNEPELDIDAAVIETGLWGLPGPTVRAGYLYVREGSRRRMVISPLTGLVRSRYIDGGIRLDAVTPGRRFSARFDADAGLYNDLGMGISQTLIGNAEVDGHRAEGVVGIERRVSA